MQVPAREGLAGRGHGDSGMGSLDAVVLVCKLFIIEAKLIHKGGRHLLDLVLGERLGEGVTGGPQPRGSPILTTRGCARTALGSVQSPSLQGSRHSGGLWQVCPSLKGCGWGPGAWTSPLPCSRQEGRTGWEREPGRTHLLKGQLVRENALHVLVLTRGMKVVGAHLQQHSRWA